MTAKILTFAMLTAELLLLPACSSTPTQVVGTIPTRTMVLKLPVQDVVDCVRNNLERDFVRALGGKVSTRERTFSDRRERWVIGEVTADTLWVVRLRMRMEGGSFVEIYTTHGDLRKKGDAEQIEQIIFFNCR